MPGGNEKLKLAIYWAASCGGCDVQITQLNELVLDLAAAADIVFWPCAMDFKYSDVEAMPDGFIDVCLFNGAIRTSEHEHAAKLLRKKSKIMVAYGACAAFGGIPALSNGTTAAESLRAAYLESPSTPNAGGALPLVSSAAADGMPMQLPVIWDTVHSLHQVIPVEYTVPGCPPTANVTEAAVAAIMSGKLPPAGAVIAGEGSVCKECKLEKRDDARMKEYRRPWEIRIEPGRCLMEQGLLCLGPATLAGCGAQCTAALMPCRGCFGPMESIADHGAAVLDSIASVMDFSDEKSCLEIAGAVKDPLGTFYRFTLSESMLRRAKISEKETK